MKYLSIAFLATLAFLAGCSQGQKVYDDPDRVSIYLYEDPVVTEDSYSIRFRFQHKHPDATHAIQKIEWNWREGIGVESFRTVNGKFKPWQHDHHRKEGLTYEKRTIDIMAGKVDGADETFSGFAMLPSDWPQKFNENYLANHVIQGRIIEEYPETATQYTLEFNRGTLIFEVVGTEVKYVWIATPADGSTEE